MLASTKAHVPYSQYAKITTFITQKLCTAIENASKSECQHTTSKQHKENVFLGMIFCIRAKNVCANLWIIL